MSHKSSQSNNKIIAKIKIGMAVNGNITLGIVATAHGMTADGKMNRGGAIGATTRVRHGGIVRGGMVAASEKGSLVVVTGCTTQAFTTQRARARMLSSDTLSSMGNLRRKALVVAFMSEQSINILACVSIALPFCISSEAAIQNRVVFCASDCASI